MLSATDIGQVLDHQTDVMGDLASGASLGVVLESIALALEEMMRASQCSVLLLDEDGRLRHGAGPSLPNAYLEAIDGLEPGPLAGSCGTAVYSGNAVVAIDVTTDPRWDEYRQVAIESGLRACWSSPIRCRQEIVGTFAVYHPWPYEPTPRDTELVKRFTHLASLAVEHDRAAKERAARNEAENALYAAERANQSKSQFVTALSHELRTPLQAITGFTENLQTLDLTADQRQIALDQIGLATKHILSIVDDVLDLARVEAGAMPFSLEAVDACDVIEACLGLIKPVADRYGIKLKHVGSPLVVRADARRLHQVILNLVSNAVRFSPPDSEVLVQSEDAGATGMIHVIDQGPGIPASLLARLFVPFDRLGADAGREGGAGLGLVLARRLSEAMEGTLEVESTVGKGTHVTVCLGAVASS